jgi:DNA replication and repair protein RecF
MLARLVLTDFRNHADAVLSPGPGFVVLTGENGAGKTNVLEAVSLLAPGRGLRRAPLSEMARQDGPGGFGVAADLADGSSLATGTQPTAPERRIIRVNGAATAAASLAEWCTLLWLTPAMDRLFVEPASERRRFLDRLTLALVPTHARHATRYEAAMRERNRLLAGAATGTPADPAWLAALEMRMAEHGTVLHEARIAAVTTLDARLAEAPDGPFARAALRLAGWTGSDLAQELARNRPRDAAAGRALIGPHRSDLAVRHRGKTSSDGEGQPAHLCSTGEQKALLLGIVLAHADLVAERIGRAPIILLDEVAAHLDPHRRAALFERLDGKGQVWMTGTEAGLFDGLTGASWIAVERGMILA